MAGASSPSTHDSSRKAEADGLDPGDRQVQHRHRQARRLGDRDPHLRDQLRGLRTLRADGADRMGLRRQLYPLRHPVHAGRPLCARPQRPCARRFPVSLLDAEDAGQARSRAILPVLLSRHHRAGLGRLPLRGLLLDDRRAFVEFAQRPAALPFQVADPDRRRPDDASGHRRGGALRDLHPHGRLAAAPPRRRGNRDTHPGAGCCRAGRNRPGRAI